MPFTFIVEDPSGNSFVENPSAPTADQYCKKTHWIRSLEEYNLMGYPITQEMYAEEVKRINAEKDSTQIKNDRNSKNYITADKRKVIQTKEE
jgi:zinc finger protein